MTFTNTKNMGKVVCKQAAMQVKLQFDYQVWNRVDDQVYKQINPIRNIISQDINK